MKTSLAAQESLARLESLRKIIRPCTFICPYGLQKKTGLDLYIAGETFQISGSFKFRAAYNLAANTSEELLITASSGNFGQALACACKMLGKKCIVVMPQNSAKLKIELTKSWGAQVELVDTAKITRAERLRQIYEEHPQAYLASAYDDDLVIEGNSSLGFEIAELEQKPDLVLVPVGGGGLSAGIIQGLEAAGQSSIEVIGAEPALANDASRSLREKRLLSLAAESSTIADGARTLSLGRRNFEILSRSMKEIIEVPETAIVEALRVAFFAANLKLEPTGALSLAALLSNADRFKGKRILCVCSGANIDPELFCSLLT